MPAQGYPSTLRCACAGVRLPLELSCQTRPTPPDACARQFSHPPLYVAAAILHVLGNTLGGLYGELHRK